MGTVSIAKEEPPKPQEPLEDLVARDLIQKQKKKLTVFEMQLLVLQSQSKTIEKRQQDLEEFKIKDLVVEYFLEQTKILNIAKLKKDFEEFYNRMKVLDQEMTEKMRKVDIMYAEVEAGFNRNARDRSDYLVHYEHTSTEVHATVGDFRQNMIDFQEKLDKLS
jgi:hypothetical protein